MPQMRRLACLLTATIGLAAGCSDDPQVAATAVADTTEATAAPSAAATGAVGLATPDPDPNTMSFLGYVAPKPATWIWQPPQNSMRVANYIVPAVGSGNQAQLIVFAIGGGADLNIERWRNQFRTADGGSVEPTMTPMTAGDLSITLVELTGEQKRSGAEWFTKDQTMLGAFIETPQQDLQITLAGDTATVSAHREAFLTMLKGLREGTPKPRRLPARLDVPPDWFYGRDGRYAGLMALEGKAAPRLTVARWMNTESGEESLEGKIVVVDFWATWCAPCRRAIPKNIDIVNKFADDGVTVVGVHATGRGVEKIPATISSTGINYPIAVDENRISQNAWQVPAFPTYAVIDRRGIVRAAGLRPDYVEPVVRMLLYEDPL